MWSWAATIAAGDTVIVWQTRESLVPLTVTPGRSFASRFGAYEHARFVGVPYGATVAAHSGRGFVRLLRPTPELWTRALPHRTQILYLADIAFVAAALALRPGARVLEAGTGSGSFSHSAARTIRPTGHLYSFDFHLPRVHAARAEFAQHGLADVITLQHRNVCKDGFALTDTVDAVFLDLPAPWDAIPHAKTAMRKDRTARICCFSPCMEQVLRTVSALNEHGFIEITMYETLLRPHDVSSVPTPAPISVAAARLRDAEHRKEARRRQQIAAAARARNEDASAATQNRLGKHPRDTDTDRDRDGDPNSENGGGGGRDAKRLRPASTIGAHAGTDLAPHPPALDAPGIASSPPTPAPAPNPSSTSTSTPPAPAAPVSLPVPPPPSLTVVSQPAREVRGHTSYLTFACLPPTVVPPLPSIPALPTPAPADHSAVPEPEQEDQDEDDGDDYDGDGGDEDKVDEEDKGD